MSESDEQVEEEEEEEASGSGMTVRGVEKREGEGESLPLAGFWVTPRLLASC